MFRLWVCETSLGRRSVNRSTRERVDSKAKPWETEAPLDGLLSVLNVKPKQAPLSTEAAKHEERLGRVK